VYKIKNILVYLYSVSEENPNSHRYNIENCIKMDKAKIFAEHTATSCGAPFPNHRSGENISRQEKYNYRSAHCHIMGANFIYISAQKDGTNFVKYEH
jgi:hypothetical protein